MTYSLFDLLGAERDVELVEYEQRNDELQWAIDQTLDASPNTEQALVTSPTVEQPIRVEYCRKPKTAGRPKQHRSRKAAAASREISDEKKYLI